MARLARLSHVTPRHFCVAGVALGDIHLHFTWQAWHLVTSTLMSRGRRGAISHPRSFCVADVALMAMSGALGPAWSRVTPRHFCVAGVALGDIHLDFTWQAWHNLTSTVVLRGRRGTHGNEWRAWARLVARDAAALCVAGVALGDIHLDFTRGTISHPRSFCVPGVALMALGGALGPAWSRVMPWHFAWQAALGDIHLGLTWQAWHLETSTFVLRGRRGPYGIGLAVVSHAIRVTRHLSHTLSHTIFHTPSLIRPLSRLFHTPSSSHNIFHTPSFTPNFVTHHL